MNRTTRTAVRGAALAAVGLGLVAASFLRDDLAEAPTAASTSPAAPALPATTTVLAVQTSLPALVVVEENRPDAARYDRDEWGGWHTSAGCTTRERVLLAASTTATQGKGCTPVCPATGPADGPACWVSPYDGAQHWHRDGLDIDHVVPLAEAQASGAGDWTPAQREAFANDPANVIAVTDSVNQSKGDQDPGEWLPDKAFQLEYAERYAGVKFAYGLTVDEAEYAALAALFGEVR